MLFKTTLSGLDACVWGAQAQTTGKTPLDNLSAHLANPWTNNVFGIEHARLIGQ